MGKLIKTRPYEDIEFLEMNISNQNEINAVIDIEKEAFGIGGSDQWVIKPISRYGRILLLKKCGKVIGIVEIIRSWDGETAYIFSFAIKKEYRNRGLGSYMLEETLKYLSCGKIKYASLTVDPKNESAINLYKKFGFRIKKVLDNEYGEGIGRLLMKLRVN